MKTPKAFDEMTDKELRQFINGYYGKNGEPDEYPDAQYSNACLELNNRLRYFLAAKYGDADCSSEGTS